VSNSLSVQGRTQIPGRSDGDRHLQTFAAVILVSALALAVGVAASYRPGLTVSICAALFSVAGCFLLPLDLLPVIAVSTAVVIPVQVYKVPIGVLPFAIWILRSQRLEVKMGIRVLAVSLGVWLILSELGASFHTNTGFLWFCTMLVTVVMPIALQRGAPSDSLRRFYVNLAACLAAYAILEAVVLQENPIFGQLYAHDLTNPVRQVWSSYRSTTLIGHPLINAVVFGSALVLSIDTYLSPHRNRLATAAKSLVLLGGLAATVSRGPTVAAAVGVIVLLFARRGDGVSIPRRALVATAIVCVSLVAVPLLLARGESSQGQASLLQRSHLVRDTKLALDKHYLLGAGPGQAEALRKREGLLHASKLPLESMFAQVIVELGIPGVTLLFALLLSVIAYGMLDQNTVGPAAALLTVLIALCTYDSIEVRQSLMILLGMLILLTIAGRKAGQDGMQR
jgi:hypothetical protein